MIQKVITSLLKYFRGDYGNQLESYITSKNPQNEGDVERYTREYHDRIIQNRYY
jgi:hypothetical protein